MKIKFSPPKIVNNDRLFRYLGFTLAETLITLVIIGIIASLAIPTLLRNYQIAQYRSGLKKPTLR